MPTTPNMGMVLPDEGGSADVWDTALNNALTLNDAHDHTTGKGVKVPSAGLKINADVSWSFGGTNYAITDAKAIDFTPVAASTMTSYSSALFANSDDSNNLYYRNSAGTNVQITDGSTLNISIVGGIGGDYASIGALLDYDDATDTYRFRQETSAAVRQYAKILSGDVRLAEYKAAGDPTPPTNFVTLKSPAALAASYSLTMPAALGASTKTMRVTSAGVVQLLSTLAFDVEIGLTLPAAEAIDLGTHTPSVGGTSGAINRWTTVASTDPLSWSIDLPPGAVIGNWQVFLQKNTNGSATVLAKLYKTNMEDGTETAVGSGDDDTQNAPGFIILTETVTHTVLENYEYYLVFTPSGSVTTGADVLYGALVTWTYP